MAFNYSYTWATTTTANACDWTFSNPDGTTGLYQATSTRRWNWSNTGTTSPSVGPTGDQSGLVQGYIYTEASSPTAFNDVYIMEYNTPLDASAHDIIVSFYTNQRGDRNNAVCVVETNEADTGWIIRGTYGGENDPNKRLTGATQYWAPQTIDLTGIVSAASTKIRWVVTLPSSGTSWHNDYGLDTISMIGTDKIVQTHQMII